MMKTMNHKKQYKVWCSAAIATMLPVLLMLSLGMSHAVQASQTMWELSETSATCDNLVPDGDFFSVNPQSWAQSNINASSFAVCQVNACASTMRNCGSARTVCRQEGGETKCSVEQTCQVNINGTWVSEDVSWAAANWKVRQVCADGDYIDEEYGICQAEPKPEVVTDKGCNVPGGPNRLVGNPCDAGTGNKYMTEVDFSSPIVTLSRSYNSLREGDEDKVKSTAMNLGVGWDSIFQHRITLTGAYMTIVAADGGIEQWTKFNEQWLGPISSRYDRIQEYDNGHILHLKNGGQVIYRQGKLVSTKPKLTAPRTRYFFSSNDLLDRVEYPFGHSIHFSHNSQGLLDTITLPDGVSTIDYRYDSHDNLIKVIKTDGTNFSHKTEREYLYEDGSFPHHLTGIIDELGQRISRYAYDNEGRAILSQRAGLFDRDKQERLTLKFDSDTQTTLYDGNGHKTVWQFQDINGIKRPTQKIYTMEGGHQTQMSMAYDSRGNMISQTDERGITTEYRYNDANQRIKIIQDKGDGEKQRTTMTYFDPPLDLVKSIVTKSASGSGDRSTTFDHKYTHDFIDYENITETGKNYAGQQESRKLQFNYHSNGNIKKISGPRPEEDATYLNYYECESGGHCGQLSQSENALGHLTTYDSYDQSGRLLQMTDPQGLRHEYDYDFQNNLLKQEVTAPSGEARQWHYEYDARNRIVRSIEPDGVMLTYTYSADYLVKVVDNLGNAIDYDYDRNGNSIKTELTDAQGGLHQRIEQQFDAHNRVKTINNVSSLTQYTRDNNGNATTAQDPRGNATHYDYDGLNRISQMTDALGQVFEYDYDRQGNLQSIQTPTGMAFEHEYDDFGNIIKEINSDKGEVYYEYDKANNLTARTDANSNVIVYDYDLLNRLIQVDHQDDALDQDYVYDECANGIGRLCTVTDQSGQTHYSYDEWGNIASVEKISSIENTSQPNTQTSLITHYTYDQGNRISSITYPSGSSIHYERDAIGRITRVSHEGQNNDTATTNTNNTDIISARQYGYGNQLKAQSWGNGLTEQRSYDQHGWLNNINAGAVFTQNYSLDPAGNIVESNSNEPELASAYFGLGDYYYESSSNQLIEQVNTQGSQQDNEQNSQHKNTSYVRDRMGNQIQQDDWEYSYNSDNRLSEIRKRDYTLVHYDYDYLNRRTSKQLIGKQETTLYHYDIFNRLMAETDEQGNTIEYVWLDNIPIAHIEKGQQADQTTLLITDHLGTPRVGMDHNQTITWRWTGDVFGSSFADSDADKDGNKTTINLRFPGQYYDHETGYHYNWHRYYDPITGRYITSDPIGLAGGMNTYGYALQNPMGYTDPTGQIVPVAYFAYLYFAAEIAATAYDIYDVGSTLLDPCQSHGSKLLAAGALAAGAFLPGAGYGAAAKGGTTVIGRVKDLQKLNKGEKSLLSRLPDKGNPKANWKQNSGVLRQEMGKGKPIRDASSGDTTGQFLNAERNLLESRGWNFDKSSNFWNPPK